MKEYGFIKGALMLFWFYLFFCLFESEFDVSESKLMKVWMKFELMQTYFFALKITFQLLAPLIVLLN